MNNRVNKWNYQQKHDPNRQSLLNVIKLQKPG